MDVHDDSVFERFLSLAKRELAAEDVLLLGEGETTPEAPNAIVARLPDGRHVVASFEAEPKDREALQRRLSILADTFSEALSTPPSERTRSRPPIQISLHEELSALALRAQAVDVIVIDVDSPVVWGSAAVRGKPRARTDFVLREVSDHELTAKIGPASSAAGLPADLESGREVSRESREDVLSVPRLDRVVPTPLESSRMASEIDPREADEDVAREPEATRLAIASVRRLDLDTLHKGRHLRHVERDSAFYLALSFSGIYLLVLVFDGEFDELRAERAAQESMARIERLVLALPPLDPGPEPMGGVIAFRARRRR